MTIEVLGFVPRISVSPETSLVSSGKRLSSAEMVSDSVPVCSMVRSPCSAELDLREAADFPRLGGELTRAPGD